jgi:hypothetical protein
MTRRERAAVVESDPGSAICPTTHLHRTHPLGGGMFVCFECWARLLLLRTERR